MERFFRSFWLLLLRQRLIDSRSQRLQPCRHIGFQVNPQSPAAARLQHRQVPSGLGVNHHAKTQLLPRNRYIDGVTRGDLQENAGVGTALVVLPGGVEEARAEAQAGGHALLVAHLVPQALNHCLMFGEHGQVGQRGEVVAGVNLVEMGAQIAGQGLGGSGCLERGGVGLGWRRA